MTHVRTPLVVLVLLLSVAGCQSGDRGDRGTAQTGPTQTTSAAASAPAGTPTPATSGGATPAGPTVTAFTTSYDWGVPSPPTRVNHPNTIPLPFLAEIHAADHPDDAPGYSRISFYFRGGFPSYEFGYVPSVEAEGTGEPISLPGNGFVRIQFSGARAHDDAGNSTIGVAPSPNLGMRNLRGYGFGGDFEGYVTYGLGLQVASNSDQVLQMRVSEVTRSDGFYIVAFDVQHG